MSIELAKQLACRAHEGQFRKYTGEPYIVHPAEVANTVKLFCYSIGLPEDKINIMVSAAWLHDVLEDCPSVSENDILIATDQETLSLVIQLTNPSKGVQAPRHVRKQMDRDHIANASWEAKVIKLCDRTANLYDMAECPYKEFVSIYIKESELLLDALIGTNVVLEGCLRLIINYIKESIPKESKC